MMNTTLSRLLMLSVMLFVTSLQAEEYLLTEKTYKQLSSAQELMEAEKYQQATTALTTLLNQTKAGSYDHAVVQQTMGYLYSAQDQFDKAAQAFQLALDSNALPEQVSHSLRFNLAQILIADGQYQKGIALMETWVGKEKQVQDSVYVMLASAYYRVENYKKVIEHISKAIDNKPKANEDWYRLLLSAHLSLKQYQSAIKVLETLIQQHPDQKVYWDQLSALYLQQNKEFTSLAVKVLVEHLNLGDAKTVIHLTDMYRYLQVPYKAAQLMDRSLAEAVLPKNFENLERLADSLLAAREPQKAVNALNQMIDMDASGETHIKLARVYVTMEQWQQVPVLLKEIRLQGENKGTAHMLLGTAYYHLGQLEQAHSEFSKAVSYAEQRNQANQWLRHTENQLKDKDDDATS